jgi:hypothetical protein
MGYQVNLLHYQEKWDNRQQESVPPRSGCGCMVRQRTEGPRAIGHAGHSPSPQESSMTNRIGNKDVAQQRNKAEKARTRRFNLEMEAVKQAVAKARYRNEVKGRVSAAQAAQAF